MVSSAHVRTRPKRSLPGHARIHELQRHRSSCTRPGDPRSQVPISSTTVTRWGCEPGTIAAAPGHPSRTLCAHRTCHSFDGKNSGHAFRPITAVPQLPYRSSAAPARNWPLVIVWSCVRARPRLRGWLAGELESPVPTSGRAKGDSRNYADEIHLKSIEKTATKMPLRFRIFQ